MNNCVEVVMGLINKIFGSYSDRQLKKIEKFVDYIESLAPKYAEMSNEELSNTTNVLKERLANGETLEDIMADAFALYGLQGKIRLLRNMLI